MVYKISLYRFGVSYIYSFLIVIFYFIFIKNINLQKIIKLISLLIFIICLSFFGLFTKNVTRIHNTKNFTVYPNLINADRISIVQEIFDIDGKLIYYKSLDGAECGVSKSPCTHFDVKVTRNVIFGYKIFKSIEK